MFWWFYQTTANVISYTDRPLIIWLQGGPGLGSSCIGNFLEIGPLDSRLEERNYSWTEEFNVLFLDNPVDVGLSYRSDQNVTVGSNTEEVGADLVSILGIWLEKFPGVKDIPLYIFGESYGGKFAVNFASRLHKEITSGRITAKLDGVGIMSGYISPMDFLNSYGRFGLAMGYLDNPQHTKYRKLKRLIKVALLEGSRHNQEEAVLLNAQILAEVFNGFDIYNIIKKTAPESKNVSTSIFRLLDDCYNLYTMKIQPQMSGTNDGNWSYISSRVHEMLRGDYFVPVTDRIEYLLNHANVKVMVFSGMFDLITNVGGTIAWMNKLNWGGATDWKKTAQEIIAIDDVNEAYVRKIDKLMLFIITQAGHYIPMDNPKTMLNILRKEILQKNFVEM